MIKRLRIIGLALLALFALGAFATSMAGAEEGLLPNAESSGTGGEGLLETTKKEKITCKAVSVLEAKFLSGSDQHGTANLHFTGCVAFGFAAQTLGDPKEVILAKVLFLICLVKPETLVFGILILPEETVHIEVPALGQLALVKGAVIAELETKGLAGKEFSYNLVGKEGVQTTATKCEINGKEFKHTLESVNDLNGAKDVAASEKALFTLKFAEEVKLEDK